MYDILNTKEELKSYGVAKTPKKFIATITDSTKRGCNKCVTVYVLAKDGEPYRLGDNHYNTASCRGEKAEARHLVKEVYGYKMKDGYTFKDENIKVHILGY